MVREDLLELIERVVLEPAAEVILAGPCERGAVRRRSIESNDAKGTYAVSGLIRALVGGSRTAEFKLGVRKDKCLTIGNRAVVGIEDHHDLRNTQGNGESGA